MLIFTIPFISSILYIFLQIIFIRKNFYRKVDRFMKKIYLTLLLPIFLFLLTGCGNNDNNTNNQVATTRYDENNSIQNNNAQNNTTNSTAKRVTVTLDNSTANNTNSTINNISENSISNETSNNIEPKSTEPTEVDLSSFSTEILTSDPNRNNNIHLTCNTLNGHIIEPGETFSFTGLLGKSTSDKGYKEANVINSEGDTIKGLGGGNCQVSSTLYNAVAQIPELEVIERHNHGAEVHYVPIGQDAAVAYGSMDFRFKNNLNSKIKLYASTDDKYITIRIAKVIE